MEISDEDEEKREKEENDKAAAQAMEDLIPDYEKPEEKEDDDADPDSLSTDGLGKVSDFGSVEKTLHTNSLNDLTNTGNLDNLIGASTALEMSDDNTEYLKRYSERVAMEAD
jgi:hypothetical protein